MSQDLGSVEWSEAIELERGRLVGVLKAYGYLDGRVEVTRRSQSAAEARTGGQKEESPLEGAFRVEFNPIPGETYRIGAIQIAGLNGSEFQTLLHELRALVGNFIGEIARGDTLLRLEDELHWRVRSLSRPFARITGRALVPTSSFKTAIVRIAMDAGPEARFGQVTVRGLGRYDPSSIVDYAQFAPGDLYRPDLLISFADTLRSLPRFRSVSVTLADKPNTDGRVDVIVTLREKPRSRDQLGEWRMTGMWLIGATLAALAFRQTVLAFGVRTRSGTVRIATGLALALLVTALGFVIERLILFTHVG
jgi:translocation and assembly module TamA